MADINEIKDEVLNEVSGGAGRDAAARPAGNRFAINLTGPYWADSYQSGGPNTLAIGWPNLFAQQYTGCGRACFLITKYNNGGYAAIGWSVQGNFNYR